MARAALGRSLLAAGGTLFVIGGGTMALSTVSMAVTKIVVDRSKKHLLVPCSVCEGQKAVTCSVCEGERVLKYVPTEALALPGTKAASSLCACALCEGNGSQTCANCLGEGMTYPDKFSWSSDPCQHANPG
ncbi:hypothetical protein CEUSTIGMA_g9608.t1 [Chlamydomonas eustigma]|uniref:CR-type domain-containing protein n=1 Tax=Chlamydomonas eustigma TaxID=1157962 RepID=A0A250XHB0_9CHLO|nr:hypothetical protein CEUSTIGMA_g9608.t1 [Chlamydomonas eustigma]|eukprot:GAX82180.1 hypothetical protein CEUSTIGMA_g9608.t1 [Chlamydomonas eustigma]